MRRARAAQRIDHDEELHDPLGDGRTRRLQHEHVLLAHVLVDPHLQVFVREAVRARSPELDADVIADGASQRGMCRSREDFQVSVHRGPE
jgi:hypothetical protein